MTKKDKLKVFEVEFKYIKDDDIRKDAEYLISNLPDYYFEVDASSTGKYHPKYASGKGGLSRHVKSAVKMAISMFEDPCIGDKYSQRDKDLVVLALLIHDGLKYGKIKEQYTRFDHPILISDFVEENKENLNMNEDDISKVRSAVASHMGPWNTSSYSDVVLPLPKTAMEKFVHLCDYLASRRFIIVEFDENDRVIDESKI